jgi:site-specific DNA-methyltransferase (adenine-specific)
MKMNVEKFINTVNNKDANELLNEIPDNSIDLIISDHPYTFTTMRGLRNYKMELNNNLDFNKLFNEYSRILKNDRVIVMFMHVGDLLKNYINIPLEFKYLTDIIWIKPSPVNFLSAKRKPLSQHESIFIFTKGKNHYNYKDAMNKGKSYIYKTNRYSKFNDVIRIDTIQNNGRYLTDIIYAPNKPRMKKSERTIHPTQKPLFLIKKLISAFSYQNEIVLDVFAGSGTTALACKELNRNYIVNDISKEYYNLIINRIGDSI